MCKGENMSLIPTLLNYDGQKMVGQKTFYTLEYIFAT
jgi:hypothetical protein